MEFLMSVARDFSFPGAEAIDDGKGLFRGQCDSASRDQAQFALESAFLSILFGFVPNGNGAAQVDQSTGITSHDQRRRKGRGPRGACVWLEL